MTVGYTCRTCGEFHPGVALCYGADAPIHWGAIPEAERHQRGELSSDQCVIDDEYFFILGRLEIPIRDNDEPFCWLVWVSLSEPNFMRACELWEEAGRENEPPYFGWLSTPVPGYPDTVNLKTHVHTRPLGNRPFIELEPTDHPLAVEQRNGITMQRVFEIAEYIEHSY
jgi:hypothetical protein